MKTVFVNLLWMAAMLFAFKSAHAQPVSLAEQLQTQLNDRKERSKLYYPNLVKRFYQQTGFQPAWIKNKDLPTQTFAAMMLLDCVLQFGLVHSDYHPDELVYDSLQAMIDTPEKISVKYRANFDILLTDALITLVNHLHYGKLNPDFSAMKIDGITHVSRFSAVTELTKANREGDFMTAILTAQPKSKAYRDLQRYTRLVKGQNVGDCYEVPESVMRQVAINMERLRWWEFGGKIAHRRKMPYLTCKIKEGLPVFYKDIRKLDPGLEAALYNTGKLSPLNKKPPLRLHNIQLKKD
jgi:hypothetical protein